MSKVKTWKTLMLVTSSQKIIRKMIKKQIFKTKKSKIDGVAILEPWVLKQLQNKPRVEC